MQADPNATSRPPSILVDDTHPDAEILQAYERVRAHRAHAYSFDDLAKSDPAAFDEVCSGLETADKAALSDEEQIFDSWALTPTGVAAQIILTITGDCDRWVDRGLMEQGLRALYEKSSLLDGRDATIVNAAYELIHIEWDQALAAYERAAEDFNLVLGMKSFIEEEAFSRRRDKDDASSAFLDDLRQRVDQLEDRFTGAPAIDRLVRTLTPDLLAYRRKSEIVIATEYGADAQPWMMRDVNFIMGRIDVEPETTGEPA